MRTITTVLAAGLCASVATAQEAEAPTEAVTETVGAIETVESAETVEAAPAAQLAPRAVILPADTLIRVAPVEEISSKKMKEGTTREFRVAEEVRRDGVTIVPLNSPVVGTVTWRTGKGIFGKSAKFEISFTSVEVDGKIYKLAGKHRQEGRGNTAAALLVSGIITGKSAVMLQDQVVEARLAEEITTTIS